MKSDSGMTHMQTQTVNAVSGSSSNLSSVLFHFSWDTCSQSPAHILQGMLSDLGRVYAQNSGFTPAVSLLSRITPPFPAVVVVPNSVLWFFRPERLQVF